jgi:hypothetical protein
MNIYRRNVVCLLLGSGPTMGWSFLSGPFWVPVAGQRLWVFSVTSPLERGMPVAGQRPDNRVVFSLVSVLRTHCWAKVVISFGSVLRLLLGSGQQWGGIYWAVSRERVYSEVAPGRRLPSRCPGMFTEPLQWATLGMCGMFDTRLSVCLCSVVLFGVRSEAKLLPRKRVGRVVSSRTCILSRCPGTCLPSRCPGTCLPSRCPKQGCVCGNVRDTSECMYGQWCFIWGPLPRNVFTEPLPRATRGMWECSRHVWVYVCAVVFYLGSVLRPSCCPGNVFAESFPRECVYRAVALGKCLASRCHGKFFVFLFLSSSKSYIAVVKFVAAVRRLPSIYLKTTASTGSTIFKVNAGTCVCGCVCAARQPVNNSWWRKYVRVRLLPQERVYRAVAQRMCLPIRCLGKC